MPLELGRLAEEEERRVAVEEGIKRARQAKASVPSVASH
jgi:hypothetical protein